MKLNPIFVFDNMSSTGINEVPSNAKVVVLDAGAGLPMEFMKKPGLSLDATSTITDLIANNGITQPSFSISDLSGIDLNTQAPVVGDTLVFDGTNWTPLNISTTVSENEFTASDGQTDFTLSSIVTQTSKIEVYTNGLRDTKGSYSVSDDGTDTTISFTDGKAENDVVDIVVYT